MQNSLWKLGALLGVVGVGFVVLLQAQKGMTANASSSGAMEDFQAIADLDDLGEKSGRVSMAYLDDSQPTAVDPASAESTSHEPTPTPSAAYDAAGAFLAKARGQSASESIEPTPAAETSHDHAHDGHDHAQRRPNPFAAFTFGTEPNEPTSETNSEPEPTQAVTSGANPFAGLVRSFANDASTVGEQVKADTREQMARVEQQAVDAVDEFNPFAGNFGLKRTPTEPVTPIAETPTREELTTLPADHPGPVLMTPPTAEVDHTMPPQQAEPALYQTVADSHDPGLSTSDEIVQVGAEQTPYGTNDPNPFLVFPGANEPTRQSTKPPTPSKTMPMVEPQGITGRSWAADNSPTTSPGNRVILPDGSVEMTIQPRGGRRSANPSQTATQQPTPRQQPSTGGFNPFATTPSRREPATAVVQPESAFPASTTFPGANPAAFDAYRSKSTPTQLPQRTYPDRNPSLSRGPIQPTAEFSNANALPSNNLTPADYVGVGTVTPGTPSTPQQAQITIEKKAPDGAVLGQPLVYSIIINNIGRSPARNVVVEDLVPKGSDLRGTDPQAQMTPDRKLVWQLGAMDPGSSRTIRIKVVPTEAGQIGSVATVSFEAAVASKTMITAPELRIDMVGPSEVRVGEKAPFKFTITNTGSADASNVWLRSIIPVGFEHPAARQQNGYTDLEYEVGTLPKGQSKPIELTLLAIAPGEYQNQAVLTADGNVSVETDKPVRVITSRLKIHREGPANRFVGRQAQFVNTLTNESTEMLRNITVTESIPTGVKFLQASDGGRFDPRQGMVTWRIASLEPGGSRRLQCLVQAETPGQLQSVVKAVDQRGDDAETQSTLAIEGFSSLTVDVANPGRPIPVGEEITMRLTIRNKGTAPANNVETLVRLPRQLRLVSVHGNIQYAPRGQDIAFAPIGRLDVNGEQKIDIILTAVEQSNDARVVVNLNSAELEQPLSEDEQVVIFAD